MTSLDNLISIINTSIPLVLKIFMLILLIFYIGFAFLLTRQARLMMSIVEVPSSNFIQVATSVHLIASIILFIISAFVL